jgi:DNA mismatch endonuclease, patch repair protein
VSGPYVPWASSPASRATMQGNRRRDTKPELAVRRAAHALGLRYRVDARPLPDLNRRADLVFSRAKVAVFVDGCYWHGCPEHATAARTNAAYWGPKISRNRSRDEETDRLLRQAGWLTLRIWEHEDPAAAAERIAKMVRAVSPQRGDEGSSRHRVG